MSCKRVRVWGRGGGEGREVREEERKVREEGNRQEGEEEGERRGEKRRGEGGEGTTVVRFTV